MSISNKILILGTCAAGNLLPWLNDRGFKSEHYIFESYIHSAIPDIEFEYYDVVMVSLTLRHIMQDANKRAEISGGHGDDISLQRILLNEKMDLYFEQCKILLQQKISEILNKVNVKKIFFMSFIEPRHNYLGRLTPRYSLSNPKYFVEQLNVELHSFIHQVTNAFYFDVNEIMDQYGREKIQDDYTDSIAHASYAHLYGDTDRILESKEPYIYNNSEKYLNEYGAILAQIVYDNIQIIENPLLIKAIIVDLDNTLWKGIAAEEDKSSSEFSEGWPLGIAEALLIYKARGGILCICSKNDLDVIKDRFNYIWHGRLLLDDFASVRINFHRKSENVREIIEEINLLPKNILFIDDNPREIDDVRSKFPDMNFLCEDHYSWRKFILLDPSCQTHNINDDAKLRTLSIQSRSKSKQNIEGQSREDWLRSLLLECRIVVVKSVEHKNYYRAIELINKTNQFNTNGVRWSEFEINELFSQNGTLVCGFAKDKFADHGMVSVAICKNGEVLQMVLSCRMFGLDIEKAMIHYISKDVLSRHDKLKGSVVDTGRNKTCHDFYQNMNFNRIDGIYFEYQSIVNCPEFIQLLFEN